VSAIDDETRRDRDAEWEPNPPPSPSRAAAALTVPEHRRTLASFLNQTSTDFARISSEPHSAEAQVSGSAGNTDSAPAIEHAGDPRGSIQDTLRDRLDVIRPQLAEPDSLFPRADYSSRGIAPTAFDTHTSARVNTAWPHDVSNSANPASGGSLVQAPLGDPRSLEGRSGGPSSLETGGPEMIAELASRLLQAVTRLEQLAQRSSSESPRPYRSAPRPFRDRVEG
jgi:hypothetical protein